MRKICISAFCLLFYIATTAVLVLVPAPVDFLILWIAVSAIILAFSILFFNSDDEVIKVKYFVPGLEPIQKISVGDWIDLRAGETVELKKDESYSIRLGVGMILPDGYEALVLPRSSTPGKFGIVVANSMGVIDNSYCGDADEWKFPAIAIRDTVIYKGDRIAQFRIIENQPKITFKTVSKLRPISRGGFGSTGKR